VKARLYIKGYVEVEVPEKNLRELTVDHHGWIMPATPESDPNIEDLLPYEYFDRDREATVTSWSAICRAHVGVVDEDLDGERKWRELDLCEACAVRIELPKADA
jgi:hypothetical protein